MTKFEYFIFTVSCMCMWWISCQAQGPTVVEPPDSTTCLSCMCTLVSNCNRSIGCNDNLCGIFQIDMSFWIKSNETAQQLQADGYDLKEEFYSCANNEKCARKAAVAYLTKYMEDCNEDDVVDCEDYASMAVYSNQDSCKQRLPRKFRRQLWECVAELNKQLKETSGINELNAPQNNVINRPNTQQNNGNTELSTENQPEENQGAQNTPNGNQGTQNNPNGNQGAQNNPSGNQGFQNNPNGNQGVQSNFNGRPAVGPSFPVNNVPQQVPTYTSPFDYPRPQYSNGHHYYHHYPSKHGYGRPFDHFTPQFSHRPQDHYYSTSLLFSLHVPKIQSPLESFYAYLDPSKSFYSGPLQNSQTQNSNFPQDGYLGTCRPEIGTWCHTCICQALTGCDKNAGCSGNACGPYRITETYWYNADGPLLENDKSLSRSESYRKCVTTVECSINIVKTYMYKYAKDCDGDGKIDCLDYAKAHIGGCNESAPDNYFQSIAKCESLKSTALSSLIRELTTYKKK